MQQCQRYATIVWNNCPTMLFDCNIHWHQYTLCIKPPPAKAAAREGPGAEIQDFPVRGVGLLGLALSTFHVLKEWYLGSDNGSLNACWICERILLRNHLFETRVPLSSLTSYCTVEFQDRKTIPEGTLSKQFSIFSLRDFHTVVWLQPSGICKVDLDSEQLLSEIIIRARHKNICRVDEILSCACT